MIDEYQNIFNTMAIIVDVGSETLKAGLSGEDKPSCTFKSLIGTPKFNKVLPIPSEMEVVGPSKEIRGLYKLEKPVKRGLVNTTTDMKLLLNRVQNELKILNNKEIPIFLTEPPFTPKKYKKEMAELLFESYDCPSIFFGTQGVLSLYSFGKTDGVVLESGDGVTQVVPVYNGYKLEHAVEKINFGGEDVSNYLKLLLRKNGIYIHSTSEQCLYNEMKESICELKGTSIIDNKYRTKVHSTELSDKKVEEIKYELPDGEVIDIGNERYFAPEILFTPSIAGYEFPGLHELLDNSIKRLDLDLRKYLYGSIYLSGGNSLINGFSERLASELDPLISEKTKLSITAANVDRTFLAWQGASTITNINSFSKLWISKKDMQEHGDRIFLMKNF